MSIFHTLFWYLQQWASNADCDVLDAKFQTDLIKHPLEETLLTFTCSKSAIETLEKSVKCVEI